ncbi:cytochrome P450 [Penicillium tannophilum]|nr:cytochrome P450 [Penicillium tannophilum]
MGFAQMSKMDSIMKESQRFNPLLLHTFDAFRFVPSEKEKGTVAAGAKTNYTSAHPGSMAFGYDQHACPGRFFAMMETKAIIGEILSRFEMKLPDGQPRPPSMTFICHIPLVQIYSKLGPGCRQNPCIDGFHVSLSDADIKMFGT